ncbi:winged helix-turn-helix domain-containing protein [Methylocella sp.]|uniref:winged helix-turn-helix domain-containing protein n=1 Tax=Methylocella sp. TaxID=1978226 RepID=UPI0035B2E883
MDAYLDIARIVLRSERRPLTPRAILAIAYQLGIVSHNLHGRTQHKTLGARLSEDLVKRSDRSLFFRPGPGKFFLREFLTDTSLPEEYRRPVPTRRRFRELVMGAALALDEKALTRFGRDKPIDPDAILELLQSDECRYEDPRHRSEGSVFFRAFVCVQRGQQVLTYRLGRYREDRDSFMYKRCIGFASLVHDFEHTLFNTEDFGIVDSGVHATKVDLDIPEVAEEPENEIRHGRLSHFIWASGQGGGDLLAVICYECPTWFEPTKRRLALNDIGWLDDPSSVNDVDDFDPWSQRVLRSAVEGRLCPGKQRARSETAHSR